MLEPLLRTVFTVQCNVPGWETHGHALYHPRKQRPYLGNPGLEGLGGNLCPANLPSEGQTAAHGQITERKYSIARFRFSLARGPSAPPFQPRRHLLHQVFELGRLLSLRRARPLGNPPQPPIREAQPPFQLQKFLDLALRDELERLADLRGNQV